MSNIIIEIENQFFATAQSVNVTPAQTLNLEMDGKIHRFATQDDKHGAKSGAYYIHADGYPNWGIMDYHIHSEMQKFKLDREGLNDSLLEQIGIQTETPKQREKRERKEYEQGREKAYKEFNRASNDLAILSNHKYIKLKKLVSLGPYARIVVTTQLGDFARPGDLLIPTINPYTGKFQALQRITAKPMTDGKHMKGFFPRTIVKGSCYPFYAKTPRRIIIAEGFATASSIFHYTAGQDTVLAAMTCHNIPDISQAMRTLHPGAQIIIAADNDLPGRNAGAKCLEMGIADKVYTPKIEGKDWNDIINFSLV